MSTSQSREQEGGNYVTTQECNASQEALREAGCNVLDVCPLCLDSGFRVRVGNHRSNESTGN